MKVFRERLAVGKGSLCVEKGVMCFIKLFDRMFIGDG